MTNGVVPIKINGPIIEEQMACFITDDNTTKGRDQNINIINGIHKIKGRTSVNILVSYCYVQQCYRCVNLKGCLEVRCCKCKCEYTMTHNACLQVPLSLGVSWNKEGINATVFTRYNSFIITICFYLYNTISIHINTH